MDLLEQTIKNILNPESSKVQIHKYSVSNGKGYISEKRNGTRINELGILEEIEVNTTFVDTLDDGTPINDKGIVLCGNCQSIVHVSNVRECHKCHKKICTLCARQKKDSEIYFCSLAHQLPFLIW